MLYSKFEKINKRTASHRVDVRNRISLGLSVVYVCLVSPGAQNYVSVLSDATHGKSGREVVAACSPLIG